MAVPTKFVVGIKRAVWPSASNVTAPLVAPLTEKRHWVAGVYESLVKVARSKSENVFCRMVALPAVDRKSVV